jgi:hypothetical protein
MLEKCCLLLAANESFQDAENNLKVLTYKLQVPYPYFKSATSEKLSKYKHLGKAGTQSHIDAVMSVFRSTVIQEIQKIIHTLDNCLLDISSGSEQEEEEPQD